ncbi:hypothetical protein CHLRE_12g497450v5 [Chlamydomonas reinhardtii]|uniref:Flagellar associated protein n=1 Tax=Chlamydomonas reinhardtii TaxID=3055 RepID=A0A2K3D3H6_CHLRE|nr:uncharacterized protein CHLRE_12g497450v5 [Chlamydomonas reinhardtii]PNW75080.1 hypothetical protein CHLRE_12g497450v5 [Chlamydomonas reinhardtii]
MTPAEPEKKPQAAVTTAEAAATKNPYLTLSTLKLSVLPNGLDKLRCLTNLDISNNPITSIPEDALPHSLVELIITGCQLVELPASIADLPRLKKLFAGANKLRAIDPVFQSASLQHAGLAYNCVAVLPPEEALRGSPLLSLDLAHNDLEGLAPTLSALAALPSLAALNLGGNPVALGPRYVLEVRQRLRQLMFLDGQRLDLPAGSRPGTSTSVNSSFHHQASGQQSMRHQSTTFGVAGGGGGGGPDGLSRMPGGASAHGSLVRPQMHGGGGSAGPGPGRSFAGGSGGAFSPHTTVHFEESEGDLGGAAEASALELELRGLEASEDPFGPVKARWAEQISTAEELGMTVPPVLELPDPPMQPVLYHIELADLEGTPLASVPLKLLPPQPPDVHTMFDPKAKAAAAAAAAKEAKAAAKPKSPKGKLGSARGKKKGAVEEEAPGVPELQRGALRVTLPIKAIVQHRNWLRSGIPITLYKTTLTAVPRQPAAGAEEAGSSPPRTPTKQATRKPKKGEEAPKVEYDITSSTEVVGTAVLRAGMQVVDGYTTEGFERLDFRPPPALFNAATGVRLPLKDGRHASHVVGSMEARLQLHVERPPWEQER